MKTNATKRTVWSVLLMAALLVMGTSFCACGGDDDEEEEYGYTYDAPLENIDKALKGNFTGYWYYVDGDAVGSVHFKKDGTGTWDNYESNLPESRDFYHERSTFTWKSDGKTLTVTANGVTSTGTITSLQAAILIEDGESALVFYPYDGDESMIKVLEDAILASYDYMHQN